MCWWLILISILLTNHLNLFLSSHETVHTLLLSSVFLICLFYLVSDCVAPLLQSRPSSVLLLSRHRAGCGDILEAGPQRDHGICPPVASEERQIHNRYDHNELQLLEQSVSHCFGSRAEWRRCSTFYIWSKANIESDSYIQSPCTELKQNTGVIDFNKLHPLRARRIQTNLIVCVCQSRVTVI